MGSLSRAVVSDKARRLESAIVLLLLGKEKDPKETGQAIRTDAEVITQMRDVRT